MAGRSAEEVSATKGIIAWAHRQGLQESGGTGGKVASLYFRLKLPKSGLELEPAYLYVGYRRALLYLQIRGMGPAFQSRESRVELGTVLRDRAGLDVDTAKEYPGVPLSELYDPARMERLLGVLDWVLERMRETDQETQPKVSGE